MLVSIEFKGRKITIKQNKQVLYTGTLEVYNNEAIFSLVNLEAKPAITVKEYRSFFKPSFDIITYKGFRELFEMTNKSLLKGYWIIKNDNCNYEIVSHPGVRISVYNNGEQVASIIQKVISVLNNPGISIAYDKQENIDILIGIALAMFGGLYKSNGNTLTFNIGHIGPQMKKLNKNWMPK